MSDVSDSEINTEFNVGCKRTKQKGEEGIERLYTQPG
jgi:hypothetical protein